MICWHCKKVLDLEKIYFKSICDDCAVWLHCCQNCCYYQQGKPNNCIIPDTDLISNCENANFCDEFKVNMKINKHNSSIQDASAKLFGDTKNLATDNNFESLFKD